MKAFYRAIVGGAFAALLASVGCGGGNEATFNEATEGASGQTTVAPEAPSSYSQYQQGGDTSGGAGAPSYPSNYGR